jgi:hypothetical protein
VLSGVLVAAAADIPAGAAGIVCPLTLRGGVIGMTSDAQGNVRIVGTGFAQMQYQDLVKGRNAQPEEFDWTLAAGVVADEGFYTLADRHGKGHQSDFTLDPSAVSVVNLDRHTRIQTVQICVHADSDDAGTG